MSFRENSENSHPVPLIKTGAMVDIYTEAGADAYLQQAAEVDGFQAVSPDLNEADDIRKKKRKNKRFNANDRGILNDIYSKLQGLSHHASEQVFQDHVSKEEIACWLQHSQKAFQDIAQDPHWVRSGSLLSYDGVLLGSCVHLFKHAVAVELVFEQDIKLFESISAMLQSRKGDSNSLPCSDVASAIVVMVGTMFLCCTLNRDRFDNPWTLEKIFKNLEGKEILEQYLRCLAIPQRTDSLESMKIIVLKSLLTCVAFIKKRFREGTPCGDAIRAILGQRDGHTVICPVALPFLQSLMQLSASLQPASAAAHNPKYCFHCHEQTSIGNLMFCARCKRAAYCSKQCQQTHWKEHKTFCVPVSRQAARVDARGPTFCFYCREQKSSDKLKFCNRCKMVTYCSKECQRAHWKEHKTICFTPGKESAKNQDASLPIIKDYLHKHYVDIMVRLVEECDKESLGIGDMVMELDFTADFNGNIPVLQNPPQFLICSNVKYIEMTMKRKEKYGEMSGNDKLRTVLHQRGPGDLMCFATHQIGMSYYVVQAIDPYTNELMYSDELVHAFRDAWVNEEYGHLECIFELEDRWEHYKEQLERLRSQRISSETRSTSIDTS